MISHHLHGRCWLLGCALVVLTSCNDKASGPYEITEVRDMDPAHAYEQPSLIADSADRFGYGRREAAPAQAPSLVWEVPDGWKEVASTAMRDANLRFGPNDEGECYVTRLGGGGGGLAANVNRWRKQMGLDETDQAAVEAMPTKLMFGQSATYVSLDGNFSGMGSDAKDNYRLLGLILTAGDGALFVKMTGPKDLVAANTDHFDTFCQSLSVADAPR